MATSISAGGFSFDLDSVGGKWYWTVQADNIQGSSQLYRVINIMSPFGRFSDVELPLPGDVVLAMADTLMQVQQQLAPLLSIISPSNPNISVTVTEGDPSSSIATIIFQNAGAFGSFLTATATPDVPWLQADPTVVAGLNKNEQGQFKVLVLPATLLSTGSPYSGHVILQDNRQPATVITYNFNVTVLPRPAILTDITQVNLTYSIGLGSSGGSQQVQVSNSGPAGSILNVTLAKVQNRSPWLQFIPTAVGPLASMAISPVTFSVINSGVPLAPGVYTETVLVSSQNASNSPVTLTVSLTVTP
jgi:hypothetical protein